MDYFPDVVKPLEPPDKTNDLFAPPGFEHFCAIAEFLCAVVKRHRAFKAAQRIFDDFAEHLPMLSHNRYAGRLRTGPVQRLVHFHPHPAGKLEHPGIGDRAFGEGVQPDLSSRESRSDAPGNAELSIHGTSGRPLRVLRHAEERQVRIGDGKDDLLDILTPDIVLERDGERGVDGGMNRRGSRDRA